MAQRAIGAGTAIGLLALMAGNLALAQDRGITYSLYGTPGLLEMPTALVAPDGEFAATVGATQAMQRTTLTFQITPRLMGSFRLGTTQDFYLPFEDPQMGLYVDRSFDLRYRLVEEGPLLPSVSVGLQDFLGAGQFSGEYLVASKALGDSFRVTAGLGWGRLGSANGFGNPLGLISSEFETRPALTGAIYDGQWFRGDAAVFGGVEWAVTDSLTFKAEYSSDAFERESALGLVTVDSPVNAGLTWEPRPGFQIAANYLYGNTFGLTGTVLFNPNNRPFDGGFDPAPVPVAQRDPGATVRERPADPESTIIDATARALAAEGIALDAMQVNAGAARIRFTNNRYRTEAQALGRAARILTRTLPASVETIILEPMALGIPTSSVTLRRTDLEQLETVAGGSVAILDRAVISEAGGAEGLTAVAPANGRLSWGIAPYAAVQFGDGENSGFGVNGGLEASARFAIRPDLVLSGALRQQLFNTADPTTELPSGELQRVRTNSAFYVQEGTTSIPSLTLAHYGRPLPEIYSRVSAGLLEPMFGGILTELLYKPVDSAWAIGAEVAYVRQREFDQLLDFQDYEVITGHGSVYYDFDNGFHGQLDVGRYLAGDWGATLSIDREFENGWRVGAFATVTDVSFDGEIDSGVDYGIRFDIPIDFVVGQPTRSSFGATFGAPERDDGQRLAVDGRLYDEIRGGHYTSLSEGWGRFWR